MKYIILADSKNTQPFEIPRQLTEINGEKLVERTVRLLKENGIEDILITAHDKRFDGLGAKRYEPLYNYYEHSPIDYKQNKGYWLNGFPIELLNEPICFVFGDVYFSEEAIKTIVETNTDSTLFFCTYNNKNPLYIKHHDEPLAYKVVDYELFKNKIQEVKKLKDEGVCCREPVVWELYRVINDQYVNEHKMTKNYVAINDISCDIDAIGDIKKLLIKLGGIKMIKVETIEKFGLEKFDELKNIVRKDPTKNEEGKLYVGDTFECTEDMAEYLTGNNALNKVVIRVLEVIPEKVKAEALTDGDEVEEKEEVKPIPKVQFKPNKKKKNKK